MAAIDHVRFLFLHFGASTTFPLMGYIFPANGIISRLDATEISQFYNFADLAGKFRQFWQILTPKLVISLI